MASQLEATSSILQLDEKERACMTYTKVLTVTEGVKVSSTSGYD